MCLFGTQELKTMVWHLLFWSFRGGNREDFIDNIGKSWEKRTTPSRGKKMPSHPFTSRYESTAMAKIKITLSMLTILLVGCASTMQMVRMERFERTSRNYVKAIRWSDFEVANSFVKVPQPGTGSPDLQKLKQVKVTSCEVKETVLLGDQTKVLRVLEIRYYKFDNITIRTLRDHQVWEYDKEKKGWYLLSGLPDFR